MEESTANLQLGPRHLQIQSNKKSKQCQRSKRVRGCERADGGAQQTRYPFAEHTNVEPDRPLHGQALHRHCGPARYQF